MKKFKVIEESRFLKKDSMMNTQGGTFCDGTPDHTYDTCVTGFENKRSCTPIQLNGYIVTSCGGVVVDSVGSCGIGFVYKNCGSNGNHHTCGGTEVDFIRPK